jgi:transposase
LDPHPVKRGFSTAVVRSVTEQGLSTFAVAHKLGVPYATAVMWVKACRERGEGALKVRKPALRPNLKKPPDERAKAILATQKAEPRAGSRRIREKMAAESQAYGVENKITHDFSGEREIDSHIKQNYKDLDQTIIPPEFTE